MTRINCGISPQRLTDEHLLAEHREIKRLPHLRFKIGTMPEKFCLGKGHLKFFADKMQYTLNRYKAIHTECLRRGFNVNDYSENWNEIDKELFGQYTPTKKDIQEVEERITDRILNGKKKFYHYEGKPITKEVSIEILKK